MLGHWECDIRDPCTDMCRVVHPPKPTVLPPVLKQQLIPSLRIGHARLNRRFIDEARCASIDTKANKLISFGVGSLLSVFRQRESLSDDFGIGRENDGCIRFANVRSILLLTHVGKRNNHGELPFRCFNERSSGRRKKHEGIARHESTTR